MSSSMISSILFSGADPALGRFDHASLSPQAVMEMLIEGLEDVDKICGSREEPKDISDWKGVNVDEDTGEVTEIDWDYLELKGSLDWKWLPSSLLLFGASWNGFSGSFDSNCLQPSLQTLFLFMNAFTGSLDLCNLHDGMELFDMGHNHLTGSIDLRYLPQSMKELTLNDNAFTESICLSHLPGVLKVLHLAVNKLRGSVDLTNLPDNLKNLYLDKNNFDGEVDLTQLPKQLERISLNDNAFSANPTKGHLSVVGWTSTPVLGEAKNLFKPLVVFLSWRRPY